MPCRRRCSPPCAIDSGCCKRPHLSYAASFQHRRAFRQCRSGCGDVVDEYRHAGIRDRGPGIRADLKRVPHVLTSLILWQFDLRGRVSDAAEQSCDRESKMLRQVFRLVESTLVFTARMQRYRHDDISIAQQCGAAFAHQGAQARWDRAAAIVLERMDDLLHAAVVVIDGAGPGDGVIGREAFVQRRCEIQARPAVFADGAVQRMEQPLPASGTRRLEKC
jgi:hypothetical protein